MEHFVLGISHLPFSHQFSTRMETAPVFSVQITGGCIQFGDFGDLSTLDKATEPELGHRGPLFGTLCEKTRYSRIFLNFSR